MMMGFIDEKILCFGSRPFGFFVFFIDVYEERNFL